jgi:penicillin-binding protein 2
VDLHRALVESCDVFFYQVGRQLEIDRISAYAQKLGLGRPTGIDLPNEKGGLVASREWKQRTQKQPWYDGETISVAIGQGPLLVTPLQLAYAVGGVASGGVFARPRLLLQSDEEPEVRRVSLKPETVRILTDALWGVVNENGTAVSARIPDVEMAGKTGTAQLVGFDTLKRIGGKPARTLTDNAWFVGFAPRRNPEIVVSVLLEHGEHGSSAAPIARDVIKAYYEGKNRPPAGQVAGAQPTQPPQARESN